MKGKHPKRRKDKDNPYNIFENEGRYYISFQDGQGAQHEFQISGQLYEAFNSFELEDLSFLNVWDRHIEQSEMWDNTLNNRVLQRSESLEETVLNKIEREKLHNAIRQLPEVQQRRLVLYYFEGFTYEQIAGLEQCKYPAVMKSVKAALKKIKKILSE